MTLVAILDVLSGASGPRTARHLWRVNGAVLLDGRLIDIASIRMAEALMAKAEVVGAAG